MNSLASLRLLALLLLTAPFAHPQEAVAPTKAPSAPDLWPKPKPTRHDFAKWEPAIAKFEAADKEAPPAKGSVLFVGSSTIVRWKTLAEDFVGVPVLNRGFGGNQIKDSTQYAGRMIFPYAPRAIFLRAGGNDINAGWPVADVFADFKAFVATMRTQWSTIPIYYIGLSPTIKRLAQIEVGNQLNDLIAAWMKDQPGLTYIDTRDLTLDKDGQVRPELFVADMLHFNEAGYKLLAERVRPFISALP